MALFWVARLTIQDLIRRRVFTIFGLFATAMVLLSFPLRQLTTGQWYRLITDVGLGAVDLSITLLAVLLGATLVAGDLERRTIYPLLAKPLSRPALVAGKFLGLASMLSLLTIVMWAATVVMLLAARQERYFPLFLPTAQAAIGIGLHALVVGAIAVMFSTFTSTTLAGTFGLALTLIGELTGSMAYFGARATSPLTRVFLSGLSRILPNLSLFNLKTLAAHATTVEWSDLRVRVGYGLLYCLVTVSLGAFIFTKRDLR